MRTIIELPKAQIEALDQLGTAERRSRAALVREAVELYLAQRTETADTRAAFGIWKDRPVDSLRYQSQLREEWDR